MAFCPIVVPPHCRLCGGGGYVPPEKRPIQVLYQSEKNGEKFRMLWDWDQAKDAKPEWDHNGYHWVAIHWREGPGSPWEEYLAPDSRRYSWLFR